jgi:pimeloyl-ACP methyl ester carboxylesterase
MGGGTVALADGVVELPSGVRLPVTRAGDGAVAFVLVHGLSSNRRLWSGVMRELGRRGHGSVAVDLRCHGEAPCPAGPEGVAVNVADLAALIRAEGLRRPVAVGQSWGGNLVVQLGADHPGLVGGVVGVDGGTIQLADGFPSWEACAAALAPPRFDGLTGEAARSLLRAHHPDWEDWAIDASLANFRVAPDGAATPRLPRARHMEILRDLWEHRPVDLFPRLAVPLLLLLAVSPGGMRHDRARLAADLAPAGSATSVDWFEPADHDVHAQQPVAVAEAILRRLDAGFFLAP